MMSLKIPDIDSYKTSYDENLAPALDEDVQMAIEEISSAVIDDIKNMPPTQEEIEYNAAKTDEECRKVFLKYNS